MGNKLANGYLLFALLISAVLQIFGETALAANFVPTDQYEPQDIHGWTVMVNRHLLTDQNQIGEPAMQLLRSDLGDIERVIPQEACTELKTVKIWLGVNDGYSLGCQYHPSRAWLKKHGYNPDKAKCVEIGNAQIFIKRAAEQPMQVLHEFAHAYLDRLAPYEKATITFAYQHAVAAGLYQAVPYYNGSIKQAYALKNESEYFAECSEAYFGRNDYYPFVRSDLEKYDQTMTTVLNDIWHQSGKI